MAAWPSDSLQLCKHPDSHGPYYGRKMCHNPVIFAGAWNLLHQLFGPLVQMIFLYCPFRWEGALRGPCSSRAVGAFTKASPRAPSIFLTMLSLGSVCQATCGERGGGLGHHSPGCHCNCPTVPPSELAAAPTTHWSRLNLPPAEGTLQFGQAICRACCAHWCFPTCLHGYVNGWVRATCTAILLQHGSCLRKRKKSDNYNFCKESNLLHLSAALTQQQGYYFTST